jgi:hypothetical protein
MGRSGNVTAVTIPATRPWFSRPRTCFTRLPHLSETLGVVPTKRPRNKQASLTSMTAAAASFRIGHWLR